MLRAGRQAEKKWGETRDTNYVQAGRPGPGSSVASGGGSVGCYQGKGSYGRHRGDRRRCLGRHTAWGGGKEAFGVPSGLSDTQREKQAGAGKHRQSQIREARRPFDKVVIQG